MTATETLTTLRARGHRFRLAAGRAEMWAPTGAPPDGLIRFRAHAVAIARLLEAETRETGDRGSGTPPRSAPPAGGASPATPPPMGAAPRPAASPPPVPDGGGSAGGAGARGGAGPAATRASKPKRPAKAKEPRAPKPPVERLPSAPIRWCAACDRPLIEPPVGPADALCPPCRDPAGAVLVDVDGLVTEADLEEALREVEGAAGLLVDFETTGTDPFIRGDRIVGVSVLADDAGMYFPVRHARGVNLPAGSLERVLEAVFQPGRPVANHNMRFDALMATYEDGGRWSHLLEPDSGIELRCSMVDAHTHYTAERKLALEVLGPQYLGDAARKHAAKEEMLGHIRALPPPPCRRGEKAPGLAARIYELPPEHVAPYAISDVADSRGLRDYFLDAVAEVDNADYSAAQLYDYSRLLARMQRHGLLFDHALAAQLRDAVGVALAADLATFRAEIELPAFSPESPLQIGNLLGLSRVNGKFPKGASGEKALKLLNDPRANTIVRLKKLRKLRSTYFMAMLRERDAAGYIHPHWKSTRTVTGRLSCSNPNFQNLPKRTKDALRLGARQCVIAEPGYIFVDVDLERAEPWLSAHYSRDQSLWEAYHENRDLYLEIANTTGITRDQGKTAWLSMNYFAGIKKLMQEYQWSWELASSVWEAFRAQCPGIIAQRKALEWEARRLGYIELWTGRRTHFSDHCGHKDEHGRPEHPQGGCNYFKAWNSLIQGGVGEIVRLAMQRLERPLGALGARLAHQIHDELVVSCPDNPDTVRTVAHLMRSVLTGRHESMGGCLDFMWLRPRVECAVGYNYRKVAEDNPHGLAPYTLDPEGGS
jgi:DNA polymerase I-like protein with 3'-5' exonuclease and polymerase domains